MATNLTTIQVQLIANAKDFKKNVDGAKSKLKGFKKIKHITICPRIFIT